MVFGNTRATKSKLEKIRNQGALLLVAYDGDEPVGFKLGYVLLDQPIFFSWLGGVHPQYRRQGIAQALLESQEKIVRGMNMRSIYFTTFDRFPEMIHLGKKNQYILSKSNFEGGEWKYWYKKELNPDHY